MFHSIPPSVLARMKYLEQIDANDRRDGTPRLRRLRQIPPETGKFLALLAAAAPALSGNRVEGRLARLAPTPPQVRVWIRRFHHQHADYIGQHRSAVSRAVEAVAHSSDLLSPHGEHPNLCVLNNAPNSRQKLPAHWPSTTTAPSIAADAFRPPIR